MRLVDMCALGGLSTLDELQVSAPWTMCLDPEIATGLTPADPDGVAPGNVAYPALRAGGGLEG